MGREQGACCFAGVVARVGGEMKPWYQYRFEEVAGKTGLAAYYWFNSMFTIELGISKRIARFLFAKLYFGGVQWEYAASFTDWRCVYGFCCE